MVLLRLFLRHLFLKHLFLKKIFWYLGASALALSLQSCSSEGRDEMRGAHGIETELASSMSRSDQVFNQCANQVTGGNFGANNYAIDSYIAGAFSQEEEAAIMACVDENV